METANLYFSASKISIFHGKKISKIIWRKDNFSQRCRIQSLQIQF